MNDATTPPDPDNPATAPADRIEPNRRQRRSDRRRSDALAAAARQSGASAAAENPGHLSAYRLVAVLIVVGALVAGFVLQDRLSSSSSVTAEAPPLSRLMPTAAAAEASSSTWFCAGGTARGDGSALPNTPGTAIAAFPTTTTTTMPTTTPPPSTTTTSTTTTSLPGSAATTTSVDPAATTTTLLKPPAVAPPQSSTTSTLAGRPGSTQGPTGSTPGTVVGSPTDLSRKPPIVAEHLLQIANASDKAQTVRLTVYPSEGSVVVRSIEVLARTRIDVALADAVRAPFASALVESAGGLLAVTHELAGPNGRSVSPCASSASSSWYFATGTTRLGTREVFVAFNPFSERAVLDFEFAVEEDSGRQVSRDSDKLKGIVVPAHGVVAIDITDVITVRQQIATVVRSRGGEGRVVIDRLLVADGSGGQPRSLNNTLGAPVPMSSWVFADGPTFEPGVETDYYAYNPGIEPTDVDVMIQPDAQASAAEAIPYSVSIRPGQYASVPVGKDGRVAANSGYWVTVQARNGGTIVVERVVRSASPAVRVGLTYTLGSPLVSRRWLVPAARLAGQRFGELALANASIDASVTLTIRVLGPSQVTQLAAFDRVDLGPGKRTTLDLDAVVPLDLPLEDGLTRFLMIEASGPVVAEITVGFADPSSIADSMAVPVRDMLALPPSDGADRPGSPGSPGTNRGGVPPGTPLVGELGVDRGSQPVPPGVSTTTTTMTIGIGVPAASTTTANQ